MRKINFNAGPATLPLPALVRARDELLELGSSGMSVMEHSHRGKEYEAIHDETIALLRELLAVPATHDIVFMQGGATQQFAQVPLNFLTEGASGSIITCFSGHHPKIIERESYTLPVAQFPPQRQACFAELSGGRVVPVARGQFARGAKHPRA